VILKEILCGGLGWIVLARDGDGGGVCACERGYDRVR
jgi:hypothetical protein